MNNHVCSVEKAGMLYNGFRKFLQNPKRIVGKYIEKGNFVADIGCGPGFFTIPMAKLVGETGYVHAFDIQQEMLEIMESNALKNRVTNIKAIKSKNDKIGMSEKFDFVLAFYMVHEVPGIDLKAFFYEIKMHLNKNGKILVVEPKFHVNRQTYTEMISMAKKTGLKVDDMQKSIASRFVLFVNN